MTDNKIQPIKATQITHPKKVEALELYRQLRGHISNICQALGIHRRTFYDWLENDEGFAIAIKEAEMELNDDLREVLVNKAGEGSTAELIFYLKHRHPDFKESGNTYVQVNFKQEANKELDEFK